MKKIFYFSLLLTAALSSAQTYSWQWAKSGGGDSGSSGTGFYENRDEMIRDIVVDNDNNSYYLTKIYPLNPNINGTPVMSYQNSDLLLFSLDCVGNLRWTRTIGGEGNSEFAWNLKLDDNGGLYLMINVANGSHVQSPNDLPIRWGDSDTMPITTVDFTDNTTTDPGLNRIFLLRYDTSNGNLKWAKPLQGAVNRTTWEGDNGVWTMDSNHNIHVILGFGAGYPMDQVDGYTIKELENALSGARYWNDYRDKVKAMYPNKPTRPFVDELFANWQD